MRDLNRNRFCQPGAAMRICVKQHLVGGFLVATILLQRAAWQGRISRGLRALACSPLPLAIVAAIYGSLEFITEGRISEAILVAAPDGPHIRPTGRARRRLSC